MKAKVKILRVILTAVCALSCVLLLGGCDLLGGSGNVNPVPGTDTGEQDGNTGERTPMC